MIGYGEPGQGIKLRKIKEIIGTEPDFTEEMLQLAYWMAGYYMHPLGEILDFMSPPETPKKPLKLLIPRSFLSNQT